MTIMSVWLFFSCVLGIKLQLNQIQNPKKNQGKTKITKSTYKLSYHKKIEK